MAEGDKKRNEKNRSISRRRTRRMISSRSKMSWRIRSKRRNQRRRLKER